MAQAVYISVEKGRELLAELDPNFLMWVISGTQIGIGPTFLKPQFVMDLVAEAVLDIAAADVGTLPPAPHPTAAPATPSFEVGSRYHHTIKGKVVPSSSLKELLNNGLNSIEDLYPGTLKELSNRKARTRRIVAQKPSDLFDDQKLADKYAAPLRSGWFYGTNNNTQTTKDWLRAACQIAGLKWGTDFKVSI